MKTYLSYELWLFYHFANTDLCLNGREHELDKKKQRIYEEQQLLRKVRKTPWELEQEKRDQGLQTSIDVNNKV